MAITRTALTGVTSKTLTDTLTIPDVEMHGGDSIKVCVIYSPSEHGNPSVEFGNVDFGSHIEGKTTTSGFWRMRYFQAIIRNSRTRDVTINFPNESASACAAIGTIIHEAGKLHVTTDNENLASTLSTTGGAQIAGHPSTIVLGWHATIGPSGDDIGSSTTGFTLGTRVGTTGDPTITAGDFVTGQLYEILTVGTTDFTAIGAASNTIGVEFTATGVGTGTGTAYHLNTNVTLQETYKLLGPTTTLAGSLVVDETYQIKTLGTTDFTLVGALTNTIGTQFVATGIGTGTGDAYFLDSVRSRLISLTLRDHMGVMAFFHPKYTFSISEMLQYHRNVNENPDWVQVLIEDDNGNGFWVHIDPDDLDDWSDALTEERIAKYVSTWVVNHVDNNLTYTADTVRDARMATFIGTEIIV